MNNYKNYGYEIIDTFNRTLFTLYRNEDYAAIKQFILSMQYVPTDTIFDGRNILHIAIIYNTTLSESNNNYMFIKYILGSPSIEKIINAKDEQNKTPSQRAIEVRNPEIQKLIYNKLKELKIDTPLDFVMKEESLQDSSKHFDLSHLLKNKPQTYNEELTTLNLEQTNQEPASEWKPRRITNKSAFSQTPVNNSIKLGGAFGKHEIIDKTVDGISNFLADILNLDKANKKMPIEPELTELPDFSITAIPPEQISPINEQPITPVNVAPIEQPEQSEKIPTSAQPDNVPEVPESIKAEEQPPTIKTSETQQEPQLDIIVTDIKPQTGGKMEEQQETVSEYIDKLVRQASDKINNDKQQIGGDRISDFNNVFMGGAFDVDDYRQRLKKRHNELSDEEIEKLVEINVKTSELHNKVTEKIKEIVKKKFKNLSDEEIEQTTKMYKSVLFGQVKPQYETGYDRAIALDKLATKSNIDAIDLEEVKSQWKERPRSRSSSRNKKTDESSSSESSDEETSAKKQKKTKKVKKSKK